MYEKILVPVDGSATSRRGLDQAIALARLSGGRIRVLHVFEAPRVVGGAAAKLLGGQDIHAAARAAGRRSLADAAACVKAAGVAVEEQFLEADGRRVCEAVAGSVRTWNASLVVLGSHGRRGVRRLMLGSDAEEILRTSTVPVLLVRDADARDA